MSLRKTENPNAAPIDTMFGLFQFGGPEGIRTHDLTDANRTLSQLVHNIAQNGFKLLQ